MLGVKREPVVNCQLQLLVAQAIAATTNGTGLDLGASKQKEEVVIANVGVLTDILAGFITIQESFDNTNWTFVEQIPLAVGVFQKRIQRNQRYLRVRVVVEPAVAGTPAPDVSLSVTLIQ